MDNMPERLHVLYLCTIMSMDIVSLKRSLVDLSTEWSSWLGASVAIASWTAFGMQCSAGCKACDKLRLSWRQYIQESLHLTFRLLSLTYCAQACSEIWQSDCDHSRACNTADDLSPVLFQCLFNCAKHAVRLHPLQTSQLNLLLALFPLLLYNCVTAIQPALLILRYLSCH